MNPPPSLSEPQRRILASVMDRILPSDDGVGAREANAIAYADWIILQRRLDSQWQCFTMGLALLDSLAVSLWGRPLADCAHHEQDAVLEKLQGTPHPTVQRFFRILVHLTLQGFLCAPCYGGNRNAIGWEYIGYSPHSLTTGSSAPPGGRA